MEGERGLGALRPGCSCREGLCVLTRLAGTVPASLAEQQPREVWPQHSRCQDGSVCVCMYLFAAYVCARVCARVHVMSGFPPVLWLMRLPAPRSGHSAAWTRVSAHELSTLTGICSQRSRHHGLLTPPLHVIACSPPASHRSTRRCCSRHRRFIVQIVLYASRPSGPAVPRRRGVRRASPRAPPVLCFEACWCRSAWWPWSPPPKPKWNGACPACALQSRVRGPVRRPRCAP